MIVIIEPRLSLVTFIAFTLQHFKPGRRMSRVMLSIFEVDAMHSEKFVELMLSLETYIKCICCKVCAFSLMASVRKKMSQRNTNHSVA